METHYYAVAVHTGNQLHLTHYIVTLSYLPNGNTTEFGVLWVLNKYTTDFSHSLVMNVFNVGHPAEA
jgi:hypothetical protein